MKLNFRLIGKIGFLLVVFGFFMPIACDQNGFEITKGLLKDGDKFIFGILMCLLIISAVIGSVIGVLLLLKKKVKPNLDWPLVIVCIASGLIVYFKFLDGLDLQLGAFVIIIGWIVALGGQVLSRKR